MKPLYLYPTLNESNASEFGLEIKDFVFTHKDVVLKENQQDVLCLNDKTFSVPSHGMTASTSIRLKSPEKLYGKTGVACTGAQIGFYAVWSNPSTIQSGSCAFTSADGINFDLRLSFAPETIKGRLTIEVHAFIAKEASPVLDDEVFLMNDCGVSLGTVMTVSVLASEEFLSFPILEVEESDKPLWWVSLDWDDPTTDRFDNSITVFINKKFKSYPHSNKDTEFLHTIIASVYFLIFKKLKASDEELLTALFNGSSDFDEFSVCHVMHHFCTQLHYLDVDDLQQKSDESLLADLQKEINRLFGGAS